MNKITKIVALFMALVLCLSFAACGGKDDEGASAVNKDDLVAMGEETVAGENEEADFVIATNPPAEATTADGEATTVAGEVTTVAGETTTAAPSDKPTQPVIVMPQTTAEVVAYFNKSVDNVKANAKTVKQEYVVNYLAASATVPSVLNGVFKMLGGDEWLDKMLADNSKGAETFSTKEAIKAGFPVENQTWASKLTADDVKSAKCELKGKIFVITIETKPDGKSSTTVRVTLPRLSTLFLPVLSTITFLVSLQASQVQHLWLTPMVRLLSRLIPLQVMFLQLSTTFSGQSTLIRQALSFRLAQDLLTQ